MYCTGPILLPLGTSWGDLGASLCILEALLNAKAPKKASRIHKDAPKAPQDVPKGRKMGPVHPILVSWNVPK